MITFGGRLKELRIHNNMTQSNLAKALKVSSSRIGMYESGRRNPDTSTLSILSDFFNVSVDYLMGRTNIKNFTSDDELKKLIMQSNINDTDTDNDIRNSLISLKEKLNSSNEIFVDGTTLSDSHKNMLLSAINVILESYVNK